MIGRRGFLKALGFSAAAAPVAAKSMTDLSASGLGLSSDAYTGFGSLVGRAGGLTVDPETVDLSRPPAQQCKWLISQLRELSDPFVRHERWRNTYVSTLDADLASMGSLSLSSKVRIQRRANYERDLAARRESLWRELKIFRSRK